MEYPKRKPTRLKDYDYSKAGVYFITICTKDREHNLSEIICVGSDASVRPTVKLTKIGQIVDECWDNINELYDDVKTGKYVIMPDHFHGIITIGSKKDTGGQGRPPLHKIIQGFKSITTRRCFEYGHKQLWQSSFYDHIIRDEEDYHARWHYIENNPVKWINAHVGEKIHTVAND